MAHSRLDAWQRSSVGLAICALLLASCSSAARPQASEPETAGDEIRGTEVQADTISSDEISVADADLNIDVAANPVPFDRRLLGTNVPAWLGPERLLDSEFQANTIASGTTLLRMPGGSWSNSYDWAACEISDETGCFWTWAARPSDFISFMEAIGVEGMWTVSINQTAQSAAAAVAFFNGDVEDQSEIGVDRNGVDWASVSTWARLRSDGGHPEPVRIDLWEIGNEVYGGKADSGDSQCASFGWEDVWTCDGAEYIDGNADHDGYLDIRRAMLDVDPNISVGGVGVPDPSGWQNWGNEVIERAGDQLDFYVVHQYAFDSSPATSDAVLRAHELWPAVVGNVRSSLSADTPIAVTEYNLVAVADRDTDQVMTTVANALYIADTIGQLATLEVGIANQWNLANGQSDNGTDYGLLDALDGTRLAQFTALEMWSDAGTALFSVEGIVDERLRFYPTRHADGRWVIIAINLSDSPVARSIGFSDRPSLITGHMSSASAKDAADRSFDMAEVDIDVDTGVVDVELPAWSISAIDVVMRR